MHVLKLVLYVHVGLFHCLLYLIKVLGQASFRVLRDTSDYKLSRERQLFNSTYGDSLSLTLFYADDAIKKLWEADSV